MSETVIALYDNLEDANNAVADLVSEGFNRSDIGLVMNHPEGSDDVTAGEGAVVGGITGLVVGLTALTIPGIGPLVAAGPLAVALGGAVGAAAGAVTGGLTASLIDMGVPESQVDFYGEALRRGSAMIAVVAEDTRVIEAMRILNRYNPFDVEHRARQWGQEGWKGYAESKQYETAHENRVRRYAPNTPR